MYWYSASLDISYLYYDVVFRESEKPHKCFQFHVMQCMHCTNMHNVQSDFKFCDRKCRLPCKSLSTVKI